MADVLGCYATSSLVDTGEGQLAGIVVSVSLDSAEQIIIYDNTSAGGNWLFTAWVTGHNPLVIFFSERFAPIYWTGLYITVGAHMLATIWTRQV